MPISLADVLNELHPDMEISWDAAGTLPDGTPDYRIEDLKIHDGSTRPTLGELEAFKATAETRLLDRKAKHRANKALLDREDIINDIKGLIQDLDNMRDLPANVKQRVETLRPEISALESLRNS